MVEVVVVLVLFVVVLLVVLVLVGLISDILSTFSPAYTHTHTHTPNNKNVSERRVLVEPQRGFVLEVVPATTKREREVGYFCPSVIRSQ